MKLLLIPAAALVLTACGSTSGPAQQPAAHPSFANGQAVATALHMTACKTHPHIQRAAPGLAWLSATGCREGTVDFFTTASSYEGFKRIVNGHSFQPILEGDRFAIWCNTSTFCAAAQRATGGSLVSPIPTFRPTRKPSSGPSSNA